MPAALLVISLAVLWAALTALPPGRRGGRRPWRSQPPLAAVADRVLAELRSLPETGDLGRRARRTTSPR
jgi:hypothetical protein